MKRLDVVLLFVLASAAAYPYTVYGTYDPCKWAIKEVLVTDYASLGDLRNRDYDHVSRLSCLNAWARHVTRIGKL